MGYKIGTDIIHVATLIDENEADILISSLSGYGIEIYRGNNLFGRWGYNLTGYTDDYYSASGNEITFSIPASEFTSTGTYYARIYVNYNSVDFPDSLRDIYSDRKIPFTIINP